MKRILREHNLFIYEEGPVWHFSSSPSYAWTYIALFVLPLAFMLTFLNAGLMLAKGASVDLAASIALVSGLLLGATLAVRKHQRRLEDEAEAKAVPLCRIDWDQQVFMARDQSIPLSRCRLLIAPQMTASAPALHIEANGSRLQLLAGHPFGASIYGAVILLEGKGMKAHKTWLPF